MKDPEELFSEAFGRFMSNWAYIMSLRQFSDLAIPLAQRALAPLHEAAVEAIANDPEYSKIIMNFDGSHGAWGDELKKFVSAGMTDTTVSQSRKAIDAASLVFAQSMLDDAAMSYCRVCALIAPDDWSKAFEAKKVSYAELIAKGQEAIRDELLDATLTQLARESLLKKVDTLLLLCKPPYDYAPIENYAYDRARLDEIDNRRHRIIHADGLKSSLNSIEPDLEYVLKTSHYLMGLVNQRYGIRVHPLKIFKPEGAHEVTPG